MVDDQGVPDGVRHVCFDLDNTLVDDTGNHLRPGVRELLASLKAHGIELSLWTGSIEQRAREILDRHGIQALFRRCVFRDDYDPAGEGLPKDISCLDADLLVDDQPYLVEYARRRGKRGFLITAFISPRVPVPPDELEQLHRLVLPGVRQSSKGR
ncbi:MAG: HAD family hydrolase [Planctomycetes bacterium]|nr:HAD family hydrolase [Planctomycetota bacterium]